MAERKRGRGGRRRRGGGRGGRGGRGGNRGADRPAVGSKRRRVDPEAATRRANDAFDTMHGEQEWDLDRVADMSMDVGGALDVDHERDTLPGEYRRGTVFENAACANLIKSCVFERRPGGLGRTARSAADPTGDDGRESNPWVATREDNCMQCTRAMEAAQTYADLWMRFEGFEADEPRTEAFFRQISIDVPDLRYEGRSDRDRQESDRDADCALRFVYKREFTAYAFFEDGGDGEAVDTLYRPIRACEHHRA